MALTKQCELWDLRAQIEEQLEARPAFLVCSPQSPEKSRLREDLTQLLHNPIETDVQFLVEGDLCVGHKVSAPSSLPLPTSLALAALTSCFLILLLLTAFLLLEIRFLLDHVHEPLP